MTSMVALGAAALAGVSILATTGNSASAASLTLQPDSPDSEAVITDLVTKCNSRQPEIVCTWGDVKTEKGPPSAEIVGADGNKQKFVNCGAGFLRENVEWSRTKGYTFTVGGRLAFEGKMNEIFASFEVKAEFSVSGSWKDESTFSSTTLLEVPVGETGWITHSIKTVAGTGTLTVQAGDNTYIIPDAQIVAPGAKDAGAVATHTRAHTASDKAICDSNTAPDGGGAASAGEGAGGLIAAPGDDLPTP